MQNKPAKSAASNFILNCRPSLNVERDWGLSAAQLTHPAAEIPPSMDLREPWWQVGSQGSTGSCVGWGAADGVLRWHFVKAGKLQIYESMSVRNIWMAAKETDAYTARPTSFIEQDGTSLKAALDIACKFGVVTSDMLPFETPPGRPELFISPIPNDPTPENTFYALAAQRKISCYFNLGRNLADWRTWIANIGPILTRLNVDSTWMDVDSTGELDFYDATYLYGGHCVALVGYTQDRFIVRNSWDVTWGDQGFAYASDDYAAAAFTEAYGVML